MNALFEGEPLDMAQRYCNAMLLMLLSAFYVTLIPFIPVICCLGAIYQYWIEKYMLLRRHRIPERMGNNIEKNLRSSLPYVVFIYALGQFLFINRLSEGKNYSVDIIMWVTLAYAILPIRTFLLHFLLKAEVERSEQDTYDNRSKHFKPDYVEMNPVVFENDPETIDSLQNDQNLSRKATKNNTSK